MVSISSIWNRNRTLLTGASLGVALALLAHAQEFRVANGTNSRAGLPSVSPSTIIGTPPSVYNDVGRGFLRWWDPVLALRQTVDTDEVSLDGTAAGIPGANWLAPGAGATGTAVNALQEDPLNPAYRYATTVAQTPGTDPTAGATSTYVWTIDNLATGRDYEVSANLPIGGTDVDPGPGVNIWFPQRYFVFRISGVQGGDDIQIIDMFSFGGGEVRFGNNGNTTSRTYVPTGTTITVTLYNTTPRAADGSFLDSGARPGNELVYADAVRAVSLADTGSAKVVATPVVMELTQQPPIGGAPQFPRRVYSSRNEDTFVGNLGESFNFATVTSFTYNGQDIADPLQVGRRNMVFSWPVRRPFDRSPAELQRYANEKRDWVLGPVPANPDINRSKQRIQVDDLNGSVQFGGTFVTQPGNASYIGPTFLQTIAVGAAADGNVRYEPYLPDGDYTVQMWVPTGGASAGLANGIQVQIFLGGTLDRTITVNPAGRSGWYTLPFQPTTGFSSTEAVPLRVIVTNLTNDVNEQGKPVIADALRFVRKADLSSTSTPAAALAFLAGWGPQDVLVAPMENGSIHCIDGHGNPATGAPPITHWTYPAEVPATDPNNDPLEDGKDRIAEAPMGFDLGSGLVANVGGTDTFYIGSKNGKVYGIQMAGRLDGTTPRRWTWPDDYNPSNPNLPMQRGMRPILGSVAFGTTTGGQPLIIVPTQEGRIYALDAAGNAASKTTTVVWQYPPAANTPLGPITTAPIVANGNVYFCANLDQTSANGAVHAISLDTGLPVWSAASAGPTNFARFDAGPLAVPRAQVDPADPEDFIYVCDSRGYFASFSAQTGALRFFAGEISSGAVGGSPRFSYTTSFDNTGTLVNDVPTVFVVSSNGTITGLHARGQTNVAGTRRVYGYRLDGSNQTAGLATGGWTVGEGHSWMYTGDDTGFVYAFNSNSDTNPNPITPGDAPGQEIGVENDPDRGDLDSIIDADFIRLLNPESYDRLRELSDTVGLSLADINAAITPGDPLYGVASRRQFEYGETLYILIWNMPRRTGSLANYFVELEMSSSKRGSQRRQVPVRPYNNDPDQPRFALVGIPIMTTGSTAVTPGKVKVDIRAVVPGQRGQRSVETPLPKPISFPDDDTWDVFVANPLALAFLDNVAAVSNSIGLDNGGGIGSGWQMPTNLADPRYGLFFDDAAIGTDQQPGGPPREVFGNVGPELTTKGDPVAHGTDGVQQLIVYDRSLMKLLLGRGMPKVRVGANDTNWVRDGSATGGVYKPLSANLVNYPGFEDYPINVPNRSLDYPDIGRQAVSATKNILGAVENPIFTQGVELVEPIFTPGDFANYRTYNSGNGYDAQLPRTLVRTVFDLRLRIPTYQPPSNAGYYGSHYCYVDTQPGGDQDLDNEAHRHWGLGARVAVDERLSVKTPTVDLGSLPSGGGYHGGAGFGPLNPWDPLSAFGPANNAFDNMFQQFELSNDGNVNMLNLRMPKYFADASGVRPVELYSPGLHELAWLDARYHLHSSLDFRYSASLVVGGGPGFDAQGRNILQKARPGDPVGTRFNVNPKSRPNANLLTVGGYLFDPSVILPGNPKVGVTAPIGAPSGSFLRKVFPFENNDQTNDQGPEGPTLDNFEPYSDPALDLKFNVREARLTNRSTVKSAPMVEALINGNEPFTWTNQQPTGARDGIGNLYVAFASNRLDAANVPSWLPKPRLEADATRQDQWRIYLGSLNADPTQVPGATQSPIGDLNGWVPNTPNRWFRHAAGPLPVEPPNNLFAVNVGIGESVDPASVRYGSPAFPSAGVTSPLDPPLGTGKPSGDTMYLAWIGEATKRDTAGSNQELSQLMMAPVTLAADGTVSVGATVVAPYDPTSRKSRPSVIQVPSGVAGRYDVAAFTMSASGALGQLNWYVYNSNTGWRYDGNARLGTAFEAVGAPSATLRRFQNSGQGRIDVTFAGKVRGRAFSEVFLGRIRTNGGMPVSGRNPLVSFANRTDEVTFDSGSGLYWAPGVQWQGGPNDTEPTGTQFINLYRLDNNGQLVSVWDGNASTYDYDPSGRIVSFSTTFGGKAYLNLETGSVQLSGGLVGRDQRLFVRYTPQIVRIAGGTAQNYRQTSHVFDDRFIGVQVFAGNPSRNLIGDLSYWGDQNNLRPQATDLVRFDRFVVSYSRTSGDGTSSARPFYKTYRFGVQLPTAIALNPDGSPMAFTVNAWGGTVLGDRFYQLDPATGRVYFMSGAEDQQVRIAYRGMDASGNPNAGITILTLRVGMVPETDEQAIPIEQVSAEGSVSLAMEPMNGNFNSSVVRRPGLVWMFWSSTRGGVPDIYMQTLAPRFTPRRPAQ